jgi:hypothetical protein
MLNDKARAMAPDMNSAQTTSVNVEWWADHSDPIKKRLKEWMLS